MNKKVVWTFKTLVNDILPTTCYLMTNETFENHTKIVEMQIHDIKTLCTQTKLHFKVVGLQDFSRVNTLLSLYLHF